MTNKNAGEAGLGCEDNYMVYGLQYTYLTLEEQLNIDPED